MNADRSSNPVLTDSVLDRLDELEATKNASISGVTLKTFLLLLVTFIAGYFGWQAAATGSTSLSVLLIGCSIGALGAGIVAAFRPQTAPITGPLYAGLQGYVLGVISQLYNADFNGIVLQAVCLTGAIFFVSLWFFQAGLIKMSNKLRTGIIIATLGVFVFYLLSFVFSLFGNGFSIISDSSPIGIAFSVVVVIVATLNLFLDFDLIQRMVQRGSPKQLEWFGAFALIVTILWLYIEALRLLGKLRG